MDLQSSPAMPIRDRFQPCGAKKQRILVVGSGPCGLVGLKEMLEAGHECTSCDVQPEIGGTFRASGEGCYDELFLTISNFFMAFSDFPPQTDCIGHSSKRQYAEYLDQYADHFQLHPHLKLSTRVNSARLDKDELWQVELECLKTGKKENLTYDYLICATGANQQKKIYDVGAFQGPVVHSSEYVNNKDFTGKHVMVVGTGESAADIASELSETAKKVTVFARGGCIIAPRWPMSFEGGIVGSGENSMNEQAVLREQSKATEQNHVLNNTPSEYLEMTNTSRMASWTNSAIWGLIRQLFWFVNKGSLAANEQIRIHSNLTRKCWQGEYGKKQSFVAWALADQAKFATKNGRLFHHLANGTAEVVVADSVTYGAKDVTMHKVNWLNNQSVEPTEHKMDLDVVLNCTGYKFECNWLMLDDDKKFCMCPRTWYKHSFPPALGHKMAFLGYARPHQGGIPACAEMLGRYVGRLQKGELSLPKDYAELAIREGKVETEFFSMTPHLRSLVDYNGFMESVAKLVGCESSPPPLLSSNYGLFGGIANRYKYWVYPCWPCCFRTHGYGAKPEVNRKVMDKFSLRNMTRYPPFGAHPMGFIHTFTGVFFIFFANMFSFLMSPITRLLRNTDLGLGMGWWFSHSKAYVLHGNSMRFTDAFTKYTVLPVLAVVLMALRFKKQLLTHAIATPYVKSMVATALAAARVAAARVSTAAVTARAAVGV